MIERLSVRHFQSIEKVDLELSRLTVVVGQSSSGKSALTRALRTLTSNARGTSFIQFGERACSVIATTERGTVSLHKGARDEYTLIKPGGDQVTFTKLGGTVPEAVSDVLGIPAKDPLNYASQFDLPFLLASPPSEVARILGELTNADIVFSAARESNRRRLQASSTLKVKADDLSQISEQSKVYARLRHQVDAVATAEEHLHRAAVIENRRAELDEILRVYQDAHEKRTAAARDAETTLPDLEPAVSASQRLDHFRALLVQSAQGKRAVDQARTDSTAAAGEIDALERLYVEELHRLGTCPACGQTTGGVTHAV